MLYIHASTGVVYYNKWRIWHHTIVLITSNEVRTHDDVKASLENSFQRVVKGQTKVNVIQAEPVATAQRTSSQDNFTFEPGWTYAD